MLAARYGFDLAAVSDLSSACLLPPCRVSCAVLAEIKRFVHKEDLNKKQFEQVLDSLCFRLTNECAKGEPFMASSAFEARVRQLTSDLLKESSLDVDFTPHPYGFPDIALGAYGIEVKFSVNDTWRSVANSVFERFKNEDIRNIYVVFGKMGGAPEVRWGRYEECVMHVRTSHVPRFEIDLDAKESLFEKFGITYAQFSRLSEEGRMRYIRKYARSRLKSGERLWWLDDGTGDARSLPLQVQLFANLSADEKLKMRAEASLLCPQIVGSSRNRTKYVDPIMFLLTYHGILATRDAFSAGSAAGPARGGIYVQKALQRIESQMISAAKYMPSSLFKEYWGRSVAPNKRIKEWLKMADVYATVATPAWKPSEVLFLGCSERSKN